MGLPMGMLSVYSLSMEKVVEKSGILSGAVAVDNIDMGIFTKQPVDMRG